MNAYKHVYPAAERQIIVQLLRDDYIKTESEKGHWSPVQKHIYMKFSPHNHLIHIIFHWQVSSVAEEKKAIAFYTPFMST